MLDMLECHVHTHFMPATNTASTPATTDLSAHFAAFCAANPTEGRRIFEQAVAKSATPAEADDRRLLCGYFCNPEFKRGLHAHVAQLNGL